MGTVLLEKILKLKDIIQNAGLEDFEILDGICTEIGRQSGSNVMLVGKTGNVLSNILLDKKESLINIRQIKGAPFIDTQLNEQFKSVYESKINTALNGYYIKNPSKDESARITSAIFPTITAGERNGTLVLYKQDGEFSEDNVIIAEFGLSAISLIIAYTENEEFVEEFRRSEIVKSSLGTLSYSELEAVIHIFEELTGVEGLLVASKIADKVGITRSVIVNALRKLESAGIIESRSLGMKGTYIKITNINLIQELKNYKN